MCNYCNCDWEHCLHWLLMNPERRWPLSGWDLSLTHSDSGTVTGDLNGGKPRWSPVPHHRDQSGFTGPAEVCRVLMPRGAARSLCKPAFNKVKASGLKREVK